MKPFNLWNESIAELFGGLSDRGETAALGLLRAAVAIPAPVPSI